MAAEAALRWRDDGEGFGRAIALAIGLHLGLLALFWLFTFLDFARETPSAAGQPAMNADLDVSDADAAAARQALEHVPEPMPIPEPLPEPVEEDTVPPPQPIPEPLPDESPVERQAQAQERVPVPDTEQQDEVRRDAISDEKRAREQEEKRRQEQIDLTERERQTEAEQRQRLEKQQEREDKLKKIRAERLKLQRQADQAEQRLRQLSDARARSASQDVQSDSSASPPPGNNGIDKNLLAQYQVAIQRAVTSNWTRPDNVPDLPCRLTIVQLPGGEVISAEVSGSCPYDEQGRRSVEAAVLKAQPLPYAGFEPVFNRRLNFTFRPSN